MYSELKCLCAAIKCIGSDMQDFEAKCFRFIFSQSKTWTTNHRQSQTKIMYMEPFLSSGKSLTPPSTCTAWWHWQCSDWDDCTAAVFSVASVALFLFVFLITFSTCISNHKANQWLKSIHTLRGCNKCWISVLLKKKSHVYSALFQTQHI